MNSAPFQLWIITNDRDIESRWGQGLSTEGWQVVFLERPAQISVSSGQAAGLALIDVEVLGSGGAQLLNPIRELNIPYIVFGSRKKHPDGEIIRLLEEGADDFIEEGTEGRLLSSIIKAHLRRLLPAISQEIEVLWSPRRRLKCDQKQMRAWCQADGGKWKPILNLTSTEFGILCLFVKNPGAALERKFILETLWQDQAGAVNPETVDKHVESLRKKLGPEGCKIQTLYGVGYAFREE